MRIRKTLLHTASWIGLISSIGSHLPADTLENFFEGETHISGNWYELPGWGQIEGANFPWIYVSNFGWLYVYESDGTWFWAYDAEMGWLAMAQSTHPVLYNYTWQEWYSWTGTESGNRIFHNYWTGSEQINEGSARQDLPARANKVFELAADRLAGVIERINNPTRFPRDTARGGSYGSWDTRESRDWTAGFFPSQLWLMYDWSGDSYWKTQAERWMKVLEQQKTNTTTHDIGFMIGTPFYLGWSLTGDPHYQDVLTTASASLATRYSETVAAIRSWSWGTHGRDGNFTVIIDNMMNLEMLMRAAEMPGAKAEWSALSIEHALTTALDIVREDGTTYHLATYDETTGDLREKGTHQGYADSSTWTRGQAWGMYGFAVMYRETEDIRFLEVARQLSDAFITRLPTDFIPPYDFDAPGLTVSKDSSAGAIAAGALQMLAKLEPDPARAAVYKDTAASILFALTGPRYLARDTDIEVMLLEGSASAGNHQMGLIYGDYYFLEALLRLLEQDSTDLP